MHSIAFVPARLEDDVALILEPAGVLGQAVGLIRRRDAVSACAG